MEGTDDDTQRTEDLSVKSKWFTAGYSAHSTATKAFAARSIYGSTPTLPSSSHRVFYSQPSGAILARQIHHSYRSKMGDFYCHFSAFLSSNLLGAGILHCGLRSRYIFVEQLYCLSQSLGRPFGQRRWPYTSH